MHKAKPKAKHTADNGNDEKLPVGSNTSNKPHCWGKMNWILKYEDGKEPITSICNCEHGAYRCKALTRQND